MGVRCGLKIPSRGHWHHMALPSDAKQWSQGTEFSIRTELMIYSFSCIPFNSECFILKVAFITTYNEVDVGHFFKIMSLWRQNHVNLTTKLRDVLYNQCKPNSRGKFVYGVRQHGWDKNFYPKRKPWISLSGVQETVVYGQTVVYTVCYSVCIF